MDLLLFVDSIQGEDKMIRDSKKSITWEITQFLEMIDKVCVKKHQMMTRKITRVKLVSDDDRGIKGSNSRKEEKKVMAKLRERVERIGKMSRELEEEEEDVTDEGSEDNGDIFNHFRSKHAPNNRVTINKSVRGSKGQNVDEGKRMMGKLRERVERISKMSRALEMADDETNRFDNEGIINKIGNGRKRVEDGNMNKMIDVEEIEDEDDHSDEEPSTKSSEDAGNTSRTYEVDEEYNFPTPETLTRKPSVKISE